MRLAIDLQEFPQLSHAGHDLLSQLLTYDPEQRISASAALRHRWFAEPPFPLDCAAMPQFTSLSLDGGDDRRRPDGCAAVLLAVSAFSRPTFHMLIYNRVG